MTGGGQGLGRAFCHALARAGAHAVVADIDADRAGSVATEVLETGNRASSIYVDVADEKSVRRMLDEVRREHGSPFALINNAALFSTLSLGPLTEISASQWRKVLDVNLTGAFLCCREVVPLMAARGYGKIVNISSATVWTGRPGYLHYVTSKAGLIGFTRSLASEVGPQGIRVNAVTPGSTETEVERPTITREAREAMGDLAALRRTQLPADLVGTILFLCAPESDFLTGQTINVDGGFSFH